MTRNILWIQEPPKASAEDWAEVWSRLLDLVPLDEDGLVAERDALLAFVLEEAMRRCSLEAENRKPGSIEDQLSAELANTRSWLEELTD